MQLIPFTNEHFDTLSSWFPDESAIVQWGGPKLYYPLDSVQMEEMLDESKSNPPTRLSWMVEHIDSFIGHVQLAFDWKNGNATLGRVAIAPNHRGLGYASLMIKPVIEIAFRDPQIKRLELNVYSFNKTAIHVYEKLGFVYEGTRRSSVAVGKGRWHTNMMSILRSEYELDDIESSTL